jgi:hypothetical protein
MQTVAIRLNPLEYKNIDSAENLIRYITRTRPDEDKKEELLAYGFTYGNQYLRPIEDMIKEFEFIHKYYSATHCLMCHYVIRFSDDNFYKLDSPLQKLCDYGSACCRYLFEMGFQACYAIHDNGEKFPHVHLAINTINYMNGRKLRQFPVELYNNIEVPLRKLLESMLKPPTNIPATIDELFD